MRLYLSLVKQEHSLLLARKGAVAHFCMYTVMSPELKDDLSSCFAVIVTSDVDELRSCLC